MLDSGLQRRGISLANKNVVELYRPSFLPEVACQQDIVR